MCSPPVGPDHYLGHMDVGIETIIISDNDSDDASDGGDVRLPPPGAARPMIAGQTLRR